MRSGAIAAVQDYRDWAVVDQFQIHIRSEFTRFNANTGKPGAREKVLIEPQGFVGWRRGGERGTALADRGVEGELRNDEQRAADCRQSQVHLAGGIGKDAHPEDAVEDVIGVRLGIAAPDAEQDYEAGADFAEQATAAADFGAGGPLNNCAHRNVL